jgi:4-amino-4-deoxy-L-arabinose transferase-like glycosyltransferase
MNRVTSRLDVWLIFGLALLVRVLAAVPQTHPNYMDAAYYLVGGQRLAQGFGFNDPYVWHYLDQPSGLPHPSHLYWMPLPSIMVALSQSIFGVNDRAAQIPFVLLSALLPALAYLIAWRVSAVRRHAWLAALLMILSPFYLPYWGVPESFAPFAVFGALALYWAGAEAKWKWLAAGACAGLAHLSRADGVLLLLPLLIVHVRLQSTADRRKIVIPHPLALILILIGYGGVMLPWFARNLNTIGTPLSTAGAQALWLCRYDELFAYGQTFDLAHLLNCGNLISSRVAGVGTGLLHWLGEAGMIFLAPLIVIGLWRERRARVLHAAVWYAGLLFAAMTLAFTYAGDRGGLFHSTGALLPFFYAAAPIGLDAGVEWIAQRRRTWRADRAKMFFSAACVIYATLLGFFVYRGRVIGSDWSAPIWNQAGEVDQAIGRWLAERDAGDPIVLVNNPPLFTYQTGLRSIVIPYGGVTDLLLAAQQFGARWLVVDSNRPELLAEIFAGPGASPAPLRWRGTIAGVQIFEVLDPP